MEEPDIHQIIITHVINNKHMSGSTSTLGCIQSEELGERVRRGAARKCERSVGHSWGTESVRDAQKGRFIHGEAG